MKERRRWAYHRAAADLWWLAVGAGALWGAWTAVSSINTYDSWSDGAKICVVAVLIAGAGVWSWSHAIGGFGRIVRFLRGRGRPNPQRLRQEVGDVRFWFALLPVPLLLAAILVPKVRDLLRYSDEGATRGNLGAMRSALSIYYGDYDGRYPREIDALTRNGKYLRSVPTAKLWGPRNTRPHPESDAVAYGIEPTDAGGWLYNNEPKDPNFGTLVVNCTHQDSRGSVWSGY
jgi:hypothetical protein